MSGDELRVPDPAATRFEDLDELTLLACLIAGEARGEPFDGKIAVAWVVRNRVAYPGARRFGNGWRGVILRKWQFSAFNQDDPNRKKILRPRHYFSEKTWGECYRAAAGVFFGYVDDPTGGADHYHTKRVSPNWSDGKTPTVEIGAHRFFRLAT